MYNRLLSVAYLPPVEYFAFFTEDNVTLDCCERYQKQSYRNRTIIANGNGPLNLTVPTVHDFKMGNITDVRIEYKTPWQRVHWKSIESAYNNTPYYLFYKDFLKPFFENKTEFLFDFNLNITKTILKLLKLNPEIQFTTDFLPYDEKSDLRTIIHPKKAKNENYQFKLTPYYQVFEEKFGFIQNLSVLDLLFNLGPQSTSYLRKLYSDFQNQKP